MSMATQAVIGIDPGVHGGVAVLAPGGLILMAKPLRPGMTQKEVVDIVRTAVSEQVLYGSTACFIERVGYRPHDGGQGAFTFGQISGLLRGAAYAFGRKVYDVNPMKWEAEMECLSGGNKNITKRRANVLFPGQKMTHAIADALLIAEYGRRFFSEENKGRGIRKVTSGLREDW